jgi:hypothetical protein
VYRATPVTNALHQTKESVGSYEAQLSAPTDKQTTTLSTSVGVSSTPVSTAMQRKLSTQGAYSEMSQLNREGLLGAGDHGEYASSTLSFASTPATSFDRPPYSASMVDAAPGVACEMARKRPDLSFPQMKKSLGQVEKSQSSGTGILKAINPTISVSTPAMNQSATRVLGQMQATATSFKADCEQGNTSLSLFSLSHGLNAQLRSPPKQ